jgi:hypothetical protein
MTDLTAVPALDPAPYLAVARWTGQRWSVAITAPDGIEAGTITVARLGEVEVRVRRLVALAGEPTAAVEVEADVPASVHVHVGVADEIRAGIWRPAHVIAVQLNEAHLTLDELGVPDDDIALIVGNGTTEPAIACRAPE